MGADCRLAVPDVLVTHPQFAPDDVFVTSTDGVGGLIYPLSVWREFESRLAKVPSTSVAKAKLLERVNVYGRQTQIAGGAVEVSPVLITSANLTTDVIIVGSTDHVRIYDLVTMSRRLAETRLTEHDAEELVFHGAGLAHPRCLAAFEPPTDLGFVESFTACNDALATYVAARPETVYSLAPRVFEELVATIMRDFGFEVQLTARTRDGGVDILAVQTDIAGIACQYVIECKRWAPHRPVSIELVRALYGVRSSRGADHAIFVTTSRFTRAVWQSAHRGELRNLALVDFERFQEWLRLYLQQKFRT